LVRHGVEAETFLYREALGCSRGYDAVKRRAALIGFLAILAAGSGHAIDPNRSLHQLVHTSWRVADGAPTSVWAMAQSSDGYLWLGTGSGLYRFDGVRFEPFRTPDEDKLGQDIVSVLALRNGDVWIGYQHGGASVLRNGKLTNYSDGLPKGSIFLKVDSQGQIWAVAKGLFYNGGLAKFSNGQWKTVGRQAGVPDESIVSLLLDKSGVFWLATKSRLMFLRPGGDRFVDSGIALGESGQPAIGQDGRLWLPDGHGGARPLAAPLSEKHRPRGSIALAGSNPLPVGRRMIFDRDGALWIARSTHGGLLRVPYPAPGLSAAGTRPVVDTFGLLDGLSSDFTSAIMEDEQGSIWVGTNLGIDRFRAGDVVAEEAIPQTSIEGYQAAISQDGALYIVGGDTLFRVDQDGSLHRLHSVGSTSSICARRDGSVLVTAEAGLSQWIGSRLIPVSGPTPLPRGNVVSCQEDSSGRLWIAILNKGIFLQDKSIWRHLPSFVSEGRATPNMMVADPRGGMWLFYEGSPLIFVKDRVVQTFSPREGLDVGSVDVVYASGHDVLVSGDRGLARLEGSRFRMLRSQNGEPLSRATGIVETAAGDTWFNSLDGIVKVSTRDLAQAFSHSGGKLAMKILDFQDGLPGLAQQDSYGQTALAGPRGRLWFITSHGMAWVDPLHAIPDARPPPVLIQSLRANGKDYPVVTGLKLPQNISNLQIVYTSPSLAVPENLKFRYRLDGIDKHWIEVGARRQAFYTSLPPGRYCFHVSTANKDEAWSPSETAFAFRIQPAPTQTNLFKAFCLLVLLALLGAVYVFTLRQMSDRIRGRLQERLGERERIARELHDTLLQGFQGLMLRFQSVAERIPPDQPLRQVMEDVLERADKVLVEGRDRIVDLRAEDPRELSQALLEAGERFKLATAAEFRVFVEGTPRDLHPVVREEVSRIGEEAISNAFRHAAASLVEAVIVYERNALRVCIRDNGVGIDPVVLASGGRSKHFGLSGMHERAARIRANLEVSSHRRAGTEVNLNVPGVFAYSARLSRRPFRPAGGTRAIEV
jgi:signal transduction histidine kinase/ligand-binding sensor domain-containing protein